MKDKMKDEGSRSKGYFHSTYLNILTRAKDDIISLKKRVKNTYKNITNYWETCCPQWILDYSSDAEILK